MSRVEWMAGREKIRAAARAVQPDSTLFPGRPHLAESHVLFAKSTVAAAFDLGE